MESVSIFLFFVSVQDLKKPAILTSNSVFLQVRMLTMDNDRLLQEREREKANNSRSVFLQTPFPSFFGLFTTFLGPFCPFCWTCIVLLAFYLVLFWLKFHRLLNHSSTSFSPGRTQS